MNGDGILGPGTLLGGRYRLVSQVGAGGMAVVWEARDDVLGRSVAVKILAGHYAGDPESRLRVRQEARTAAALSHPHIAQVYDYGETVIDGLTVPFVVMELIRGRTLHQRLTEGPVLPRFAMQVCAEVAAALAAAHAEGLAHRDIKPANVMLAGTGAKVVDFGIAAAVRPPGPGAVDFEVLGTPAYLAPERLLHDAVEPASDVYALGVLLYRLLAGHSPWTTETTTQMLTAHVYLEPAPLLPIYQVPQLVTDLCNRCLAKDPADRPSAREAAALLAHGAGLQVATDEPPAPVPAAVFAPPAPARAASRRGRVAVSVAAALALAGVAAATTWFLRPDEGPAAATSPGSIVVPPSLAVPSPARASQPPSGRREPAPAHTTTRKPATTVPQAPPSTVSQAPRATVPEAPPTTAPEAPPAPRTLSSEAGSVRATCPSGETAQILSWTAAKPYKVVEGDKAAGPAPEVSFKHGNTRLTMTVTCTAGVPAATSS
ncbi:serine/threonine-protein kinase [Actinoplanes sp. RD1]|uniref:serine/threonine-protein kinase n=1 Tax=Actinoplanes sp. RD1 TaxID=3064538 RepID=UPI0027424F57|nr:protein kinase [Actinoplanes sp. RD1]